MIARHLNFLIRLVCSDDAICKTAREILQQDEHVVDEPTSSARETCLIHFRRQVVMIKNKALAKQLVKGRDEYKCVRWIVSMDNIKSLAEENQQGEHERGGHGVAVLPEVSEKAIGCLRLRIPIKVHTVHCLPRKLAGARRTYDRHPVACSGQCVGLSSNPKVSR